MHTSSPCHLQGADGGDDDNSRNGGYHADDNAHGDTEDDIPATL